MTLNFVYLLPFAAVYGLPLLAVLPGIAGNRFDVGREATDFSFEQIEIRKQLAHAWFYLPIAAYTFGVVGNLGVSFLLEDVENGVGAERGLNFLFYGAVAIEAVGIFAMYAVGFRGGKNPPSRVGTIYVELQRLETMENIRQLRAKVKELESSFNSLLENRPKSLAHNIGVLRRLAPEGDWDWKLAPVLGFMRWEPVGPIGRFSWHDIWWSASRRVLSWGVMVVSLLALSGYVYGLALTAGLGWWEWLLAAGVGFTIPLWGLVCILVGARALLIAEARHAAEELALEKEILHMFERLYARNEWPLLASFNLFGIRMTLSR